MELFIPKNKFVCIDYPGVVVNTDKMLQTLGGEKNISKAYNDPSKRLELWFRPREISCKPMYGDRLLSSSLLLKVRRRKKQKSMEVCDEASDCEQFEYDANVLGIIDMGYTFQSLSDFQYLPMVRQPSGSYSSILEKVFITKLHGASWMNESSPLFVPPIMFSRFDRSTDYCYREPPQPRPGRENALPKLAPNIIGVSRKRRPHFTKFLHFTDKDIPTEPNPSALNAVHKKPTMADALTNVKELFEMQPIWSRNALFAHTNPCFSLSDICAVLPTIAYYFVTGPWRTMWIRFGYDPRQHTEAKIYQTLDVRLRRHYINDVIRVRAKRSTYEYSLPKTSLKSQSQPSLIQKTTFMMTDRNKELSKSLSRTDLDATFRFRPGMLPAYRQLFYQLCYIEESRVQQLIHANDGQETECLEKDGWCLRDTVDKCRSILAQCIKTVADTVIMNDLRLLVHETLLAETKPETFNLETETLSNSIKRRQRRYLGYVSRPRPHPWLYTRWRREGNSAGSDATASVTTRLPSEPVLEFDGQEDVDRVPSGEEDDDDDDDDDDFDEQDDDEAENYTEDAANNEDDEDDDEPINFTVKTNLGTELNFSLT